MNYKQSKKILKEVKNAKRIFLACHESPDIDSVLSCILLKRILKKIGKSFVDIYSIDNVGHIKNLLSLDDEIIYTSSSKLDTSNYDLLFALDINEIKRFGFGTDFNFKGTIINIDHHDDQGLGDIKINDINAGGTCQILYYLFEDWGVKIDKDILNKILIGILSDTDVFHFAIYESPIIFDTVAKLIREGADYQQALYLVDQSYDLETFKFIAAGIQNIKIDIKNKFAYTALSYPEIKKYEKFGARTRQLSDGYLRKIKGTNFGIVMIEDENGNTKISVRSRTPGYYVNKLVEQLGGGGHITGGGAAIKDTPFEKAIQKVLQVARKYAKTGDK